MTRRNLIAVSATVLAGNTVAFARVDWPSSWRIVDAVSGKDVRWRDFPGRLATYDVVFVGEQHDDPETHRVELALLQALQERLGNRLTLAMEMFERDNQSGLSDYLAGRISSDEFSKVVRLWKNYLTDYRPLIEFAREKAVPVIASNAPQSLVRRVSREGLSALGNLTPEEKGWVARYINAPVGDEYERRFQEVMNQGHGSNGPAMDPTMVRRFYEAQCVRDDTMAESVVLALRDRKTILHINGSFHSDAGLGTAARVHWRKPLGTRIGIVKVVPTRTPPTMDNLKGEADYVIFVPDQRFASEK